LSFQKGIDRHPWIPSYTDAVQTERKEEGDEKFTAPATCIFIPEHKNAVLQPHISATDRKAKGWLDKRGSAWFTGLEEQIIHFSSCHALWERERKKEREREREKEREGQREREHLPKNADRVNDTQQLKECQTFPFYVSGSVVGIVLIVWIASFKLAKKESTRATADSQADDDEAAAYNDVDNSTKPIRFTSILNTRLLNSTLAAGRGRKKIANPGLPKVHITGNLSFFFRRSPRHSLLGIKSSTKKSWIIKVFIVFIRQ
jgi:hypothetical protein